MIIPIWEFKLDHLLIEESISWYTVKKLPCPECGVYELRWFIIKDCVCRDCFRTVDKVTFHNKPSLNKAKIIITDAQFSKDDAQFSSLKDIALHFNKSRNTITSWLSQGKVIKHNNWYYIK